MALTVAETEERGLLDELAKVFSGEDDAYALLGSVGVSPQRSPSFRAAGNSLNFWRQACRLLQDGIVEGGIEALLASAARSFPYNSRFTPWSSVAVPGRGAPGGSAREGRSRTGTAKRSQRQALGTPANGPRAQPLAAEQRVFLCHSNNDKPAVRDLYRRLQADGMAPWLDEEDLFPGEVWRAGIRRAMRHSRAVVVCLTRGSIEKSGYVNTEIVIALEILDEQPEGKIFLIPARLEDCVIPDRLSHLHRVDLFAPGGYEKLLQSLRLGTVSR